MGILGFSWGILPACVVGTSFSTISYISRHCTRKERFEESKMYAFFFLILLSSTLTLPTQHRNLQMTLTLVPLFISRLASGFIGHIPLLGWTSYVTPTT